jgi:hypothetical protein
MSNYFLKYFLAAVCRERPRACFQNRSGRFFSLAPGFSPVIRGGRAVQPLQRLPRWRKSR